MTLINKINLIFGASLFVALASSCISYFFSNFENKNSVQQVSKDFFEENPWGRSGEQDEEGGDAWWKSQTEKKFK